MSGRIRILSGLVLAFALALWGCQKAQQASSGSPDMAEAAKADAGSEHSSKMKFRSTGGSRISTSHESGESGKKESAPVMRKAGTLTASDNEKDFDFRQGQIITVALDSNKASGLSWSLVEPAGSIIVADGSPMYSVRAGKNAGGSETWHFRAAKPGLQTVKMEYRRKWAQSVPERSFRFTGQVR